MRRGFEVVGFVVKVEYMERDPTRHGMRKVRREVSRLYHSRSAAEECCRLFAKVNPDRDYYVHEKGGRDDAGIA